MPMPFEEEYFENLGTPYGNDFVRTTTHCGKTWQFKTAELPGFADHIEIKCPVCGEVICEVRHDTGSTPRLHELSPKEAAEYMQNVQKMKTALNLKFGKEGREV